MIRTHLIILSWSIPAGFGLVIGCLAGVGFISGIETIWKYFFGPRKKEEN